MDKFGGIETIAQDTQSTVEVASKVAPQESREASSDTKSNSGESLVLVIPDSVKKIQIERPVEETAGTKEDVRKVENEQKEKLESKQEAVYTFEGAKELQEDVEKILSRKQELANHSYDKLEKTRQETLDHQKENLKKFSGLLKEITLTDISEYLHAEGVPHTTEGFFEFIERKKKIPDEVTKMSEIVSSLMGERTNRETVFPVINNYESLKQESDFSDKQLYVEYLEGVAGTVNGDVDAIKHHLENMSEYIDAYTVELEAELNFTFIKKPDIENDKDLDTKIDKDREMLDLKIEELQTLQKEKRDFEKKLKDEQQGKRRLEAQAESEARSKLLEITNQTLQGLEVSLKDQTLKIQNTEEKISRLTAEMDDFKSKKVTRIRSDYMVISDDIYDKTNDLILKLGDIVGNVTPRTETQMRNFIKDVKEKLGDAFSEEQEKKLNEMITTRINAFINEQTKNAIIDKLWDKTSYLKQIIEIAHRYGAFKK